MKKNCKWTHIEEEKEDHRRRTHIQGESPVDVIVLDGESKDEAPKDERDHVVHVRPGDGICGCDPEHREQEERRHRGHWHRHGLSQPPRKHPRQHAEHVTAGHRPVEPDAEARHGAQERAERDERVPQREEIEEGRGGL